MKVLDELPAACPNTTILLTLGGAGGVCHHTGKRYRRGVYPVTAVGTTAAGDTFCGYFLNTFYTTNDVKKALDIAARAASVCVSRSGAAQSVPYANEVR